VERIYRKEEIYEGPLLEQAPDLVLLGSRGVNFKAGLRSEKLGESSVLAGKHTQPDAFLLVHNCPEHRIPSNPTVCDVLGVIEELRKEAN